MGRYDDDDSEYVVYGNMGSARNYECKKLRDFKEAFCDKYAHSEVSLDGRTTAEIETLAEILNKINNGNELTNDDKKLMVSYGAKDTLLKEDITYDDIKDLPEYQELSSLVETKDFFSAHRQIVNSFYSEMEKLSQQDNDKSLYLRLTMMTKYQQFKKGSMRYEDPKRRLYFMRTYLGLESDTHLDSFLTISHCEDSDYYYGSLNSLLQGIPPKNVKDILPQSLLYIVYHHSYDNMQTALGDKQKLLPYILESINDQGTDGMTKERLIRIVATWIDKNHYDRDGNGSGKFVDGTLLKRIDNKPYEEFETQFYDAIDDTLLQRADAAMQQGDFELLAYISEGIMKRIDEMNPKTKNLTSNQIAFYEKYCQELIKQDGFVLRMPKEYLEKASDNNLNLILDDIKYKGWRFYFRDYLTAHGISAYDATNFANLIENHKDKLSEAIKEGFWIRTTEDKIRNYNELCHPIYEAHQAPLDDADKIQIREVGLELLQQLKKEHSLSESDIDQLNNDTLLVLTFTGDVKDKKIHPQNYDNNKIEEILLQAGYLKPSAESQVSCSPVSQYCDINETWIEDDYKTNLLDMKLQRDKISDVIDLLNRGVNVSAKVERVNREKKKFPISPFDRYISGILYRDKARILWQLDENMKRIAQEVNPNKLYLVSKIFNSLSFKTRNDIRVKEIEKEVNQIISKRSPNIFAKQGKEY